MGVVNFKRYKYQPWNESMSQFPFDACPGLYSQKELEFLAFYLETTAILSNKQIKYAHILMEKLKQEYLRKKLIYTLRKPK